MASTHGVGGRQGRCDEVVSAVIDGCRRTEALSDSALSLASAVVMTWLDGGRPLNGECADAALARGSERFAGLKRASWRG